ncbi:hypothetical protein GCM10027589_41800 [Actinocorallia lasiicapitis]
MRSRFAAVAVMVGAGLISAAPAEARTAPADTIIVGDGAVVGLWPDRYSRFTVKVRLTDPSAAFATIDLEGPDDTARISGPLKDPDGDRIYSHTFKLSSIDRVGVWLIRTEYFSSSLQGGTGEFMTGPPGIFNTRSGTTLTAKPSTRKLRKNARLTLTGRLRAMNEYGMYTPHPFARLRIYFRKPGTKTWTYKTSTSTNANGTYRKHVKPTTTGTWSVKYLGDYFTMPLRKTTPTIKLR